MFHLFQLQRCSLQKQNIHQKKKKQTLFLDFSLQKIPPPLFKNMLFIWVLFWIVFVNIRMFPYYIIDVITFPRKTIRKKKMVRACTFLQGFLTTCRYSLKNYISEKKRPSWTHLEALDVLGSWRRATKFLQHLVTPSTRTDVVTLSSVASWAKKWVSGYRKWRFCTLYITRLFGGMWFLRIHKMDPYIAYTYRWGILPF